MLSYRNSVLRIRNVYPGSVFFPSRIPDLNFFHPGSASKNLSNITHPAFLTIPDPGDRGKKGTGSRIRIRNTAGIRGKWSRSRFQHFIPVKSLIKNHERLGADFLRGIPASADQRTYAGPGSIWSLPDTRLCRLPQVSSLNEIVSQDSTVGFQLVQTSEHMLALGVFGLCQILAFVDYLR